MSVKTFNRFLFEKNVASLDSSHSIYMNPSSSDITALLKEGVKEPRFIIESTNEDLFVFNGDIFVHYDAMKALKKAKILINPVLDQEKPAFYESFYTGTAKIVGGRLVFDNSDCYEYLIKDFASKDPKIKKEVKLLFDYFKKNINEIMRVYRFVDELIEGSYQPFIQLKKVLDGN